MFTVTVTLAELQAEVNVTGNLPLELLSDLTVKVFVPPALTFCVALVRNCKFVFPSDCLAVTLPVVVALITKLSVLPPFLLIVMDDLLTVKAEQPEGPVLETGPLGATQVLHGSRQGDTVVLVIAVPVEISPD